MAYRAAVTQIPGDGFRPWASRLGDYQRATYYVPTSTIPYANQPVTGGLGQMSLSSLTSNPLFWAAAAAGAWFFFLRKR